MLPDQNEHLWQDSQINVNAMAFNQPRYNNHKYHAGQNLEKNVQWPDKSQDSNRNWNTITCYGCKEIGHLVRDCPNRDGSIKCEFSAHIGHDKRNCAILRGINERMSKNESTAEMEVKADNN